ncbi:MAG: hypothetical protein ACI9KE_004267 [Polyangiales bacterium]|jgi:hypothetical protein
MRGSKRGTILTTGRRRIVIALAILSAAATVVSMLYGAKLRGMTPTAMDSYGAGPLGHRLFAETLIELDYFVAQNRGANFTGTPNPLWFLEPKAQGRAGGFDQELAPVLAERAAVGLPTIVVLPKWLLYPTRDNVPTIGQDSVGPGLIRDAALPGAQLTLIEGDSVRELTGILGTFVVELPNLQVFTSIGSYDEVLLDAAEGAVVVRSASGGIVVSDPDIFHNYNFHRAQHADLALAILQRGFSSTSDTLVFDEVFHGHGAQFSLGEAMGEFPAVLIVVHLVLVMLILFSMGTRRFGPALSAEPIGHGPMEAIEVSASVLADGQGAGSIVFQYVCEVLQHAHSNLGLPTKPTLDAIAASLDEALVRRGGTAAALRLYARAIELRFEKKNSAELWRIATAVHSFRDELLARRRGAQDSTKRKDIASPNQNNPEQAA